MFTFEELRLFHHFEQGRYPTETQECEPSVPRKIGARTAPILIAVATLSMSGLSGCVTLNDMFSSGDNNNHFARSNSGLIVPPGESLRALAGSQTVSQKTAPSTPVLEKEEKGFLNQVREVLGLDDDSDEKESKEKPEKTTTIVYQEVQDGTLISVADNGDVFFGAESLPENTKFELDTLPSDASDKAVADIKKENGETMFITQAGDVVFTQLESLLPEGYEVSARATLNTDDIGIRGEITKKVVEEGHAYKGGVEARIDQDVQSAAISLYGALRLESDNIKAGAQKALTAFAKLGTNSQSIGLGYVQELEEALFNMDVAVRHIQKFSQGELPEGIGAYNIEDVSLATLRAAYESELTKVEASISMLLDGKVIEPGGQESTGITLDPGSFIAEVRTKTPAAINDLFELPGTLKTSTYFTHGADGIGTYGLEGTYSPKDTAWGGMDVSGLDLTLGLKNQKVASITNGVVEKRDDLRAVFGAGYQINSYTHIGARVEPSFTTGEIEYVSVNVHVDSDVKKAPTQSETMAQNKFIERQRSLVDEKLLLVRAAIQKDNIAVQQRNAQAARGVLNMLQSGSFENMERSYESFMTLLALKQIPNPSYKNVSLISKYAIYVVSRKLQEASYTSSPQLLDSLSWQVELLRSLVQSSIQGEKDDLNKTKLVELSAELNVLLEDIASAKETGLSAFQKRAFMEKVIGIAEDMGADLDAQTLRAIFNAALAGQEQVSNNSVISYTLTNCGGAINGCGVDVQDAGTFTLEAVATYGTNTGRYVQTAPSTIAFTDNGDGTGDFTANGANQTNYVIVSKREGLGIAGIKKQVLLRFVTDGANNVTITQIDEKEFN